MRLALVSVLCISSTAFAETPATTAKAFVTTQLAAITKGDNAAFQATFAADARLRGYVDDPLSKRASIDMQDAFMSGSPHNEFKKIKLDKLVAGGDANAIWLTADISATYDNYEPEDQGSGRTVRHSRLTELIVPDGTTWKVVAAMLSSPTSASGNIHPEHRMIGDATKPGPLAPLVASPPDLIKKLSADKNLFVLGTDEKERAIGPAAAKKLLGKWTKLNLTIDDKSVREVATKTYAFAEVSVMYTTTETVKLTAAPWKRTDTHYHHMTALVLAVPSGSDWSVVGVHYTAD